MEGLHELNQILEEKNQKIQDLENKVENLNANFNYDLRFWREMISLPVDDFRQDLPVPRLEMMLRKLENHGYEWIYGTVRMAHFGMRKEYGSKTLNLTPLSRTTTTWVSNNQPTIPQPYRDYDHIQYDSLALKLPAYITFPEKEIYEKIEINDFIKKQFDKDFKELLDKKET